ncbi:2-pyrone-4,6-dicarboxylate hydrolase [Frondihabitans sp. PAMC 28766]|uniref:amidohydrolase family protein n=1 Tax=Frondihabitans sp. PAMC 28766 TaxID=1795630 RepID=UPI00078BD9C2|nr:amidohydrolase family protein [Frondihabitans sp. PAMC 28766]AMM21494.1 2-pyrone-4,6-dicarboxylate hydrolase [Frondihabitans sp. PAMC 28766]
MPTPPADDVFDAHFHIIDKRFPLVANNGFMPDEFSVADYRAHSAELGITGGVVVSGSFQEFDDTYLVDALETLGQSFVGVVNVADDATDDDLLRLASAGVRGVRFNLYRGGSAGLDSVATLGRRAWDVAGLHSEFYLDAHDLDTLEPLLASLPKVSIDHLGMTSANRDALLRLVSAGVHVKATGFGRVDLDVASTVAEIHAANPAALMFGTDLPSTRARTPFRPADITLLTEALPTGARAALHDNAAAFYGLSA